MTRDAQSLRPATGVRYAVELASYEDGRAVYRGAIHVPDASWPLEVTVDGERAEAHVEGPEPAQGHAKAAAALVKSAAKLPRPAGSGPPPRRVVRWRA